MTIDTLGYVKRLEAAGVDRKQAEAHAEAFRDEVSSQLATKADLEKLGDKLSANFEAALWKHTLGILLGFIAIAGLAARFLQP